MIIYYAERGYPVAILKRFAKQAQSFKQTDLLDIDEKPTNNRPIMVTQYNTIDPDMNKWLSNHWNILHTSRESARIFPDKPMVAFKRRPTLRDILTSSKVQYPALEANKTQTYPIICKKAPGKCSHCPSISREDKRICTYTGFPYDKQYMQQAIHRAVIKNFRTQNV